jgi:hypothetical protein
VTGVEWRVAALCTQLADDQLARLLTDAGAEPVLARVLDTVRAGKPAEVSPADLDALEETAASIGIDGLTTGVRSLDSATISTRLPGIGGSGPHFAWVCPQKACTRVELDTLGTKPICAISGEQLTRTTQS